MHYWKKELLGWLSGKGLPANAGDAAQSLGGEDPWEEDTATHSSILAWRIPWTEEPGGLQLIGSQRIGHDWSDLAWSMHKFGLSNEKTPEGHQRVNKKQNKKFLLSSFSAGQDFAEADFLLLRPQLIFDCYSSCLFLIALLSSLNCSRPCFPALTSPWRP